MTTTITLVHEPAKAEIIKLKTEAGLEFYQVHLSQTNGDSIYLLVSEESLINLYSALSTEFDKGVWDKALPNKKCYCTAINRCEEHEIH